MRWMKSHKVVLDIAARLVHLYSPMYGEVTLHLPAISHIRECLHHMVERRLEDIQVVWEFPDVFPEDLPGMPPEIAIEFKIELQPGTAPIANALYKMSLLDRIEGSTPGFVRQRFYPPKFITLGLSDIVRIKER
jgi:hypothetical protein